MPPHNVLRSNPPLDRSDPRETPFPFINPLSWRTISATDERCKCLLVGSRRWLCLIYVHARWVAAGYHLVCIHSASASQEFPHPRFLSDQEVREGHTKSGVNVLRLAVGGCQCRVEAVGDKTHPALSIPSHRPFACDILHQLSRQL